MDRAVVVGLGITGRAVVEALRRRGVEVVAFDDRPTEALSAWADRIGIAVARPADGGLGAALAGADAMIPAPGLPDHHPVFDAARAAGVEVLSEFDLAAQWDTRPFVAVTGTDGKTTVVTLIQRMLAESGVASVAVGNTDTPFVVAIEDRSIDVFVVEASSFRLGHSRGFAPTVGTWLNFGPDHLDAHVDLAAYEAAKASIWRDMRPGTLAVANRDDAVVARHAARLAPAEGVDVETFGAGPPPTQRDHGIDRGALVLAGRPLLQVSELNRSMPHDLANALAAAASAQRVGASRDAIAAVLRRFDGLAHRVELIGEIGGVRYVNDSKATTPHAAAAALGGFESIVLLAGGKNKGLAFDDMLEHRSHLKHVVALGEAADDIIAVFGADITTTRATSMEQAIEQASEIAGPGDVVLLSPACASYDWYGSYVERGEHFGRLVRERMAAEAMTNRSRSDEVTSP